jgi:hypothetical protein
MVSQFCRGGFWPPRLPETTFRHPHPIIPRQFAPQQSLLLFHWTNQIISRFPEGLARGREMRSGDLVFLIFTLIVSMISRNDSTKQSVARKLDGVGTCGEEKLI